MKIQEYEKYKMFKGKGENESYFLKDSLSTISNPTRYYSITNWCKKNPRRIKCYC